MDVSIDFIKGIIPATETFLSYSAPNFPIPTLRGLFPTIYADFANNHYWFNSTVYPGFYPWTIALNGSFTRSSQAYYVDSNGYYALAGNNVLRFNHDKDGNALGLLLENLQQNHLTNSQVFAADGHSIATTTDNNATSPDGTVNACKFDVTAGTGNAGIWQPFGIGANVVTTISVFAKAGTASFLALNFGGRTANVYVCQVFDLSTGTLGESSVGTNGTFINAAIEDVGRGWYRCNLVASCTDATVDWEVWAAAAKTGNSFNTFGEPNLTNFTGNFYIWQKDMVDAKFWTSPILTTSAPAARSDDSYVLVPGSSILSNTAGTVIASWNTLVDSSGPTSGVWMVVNHEVSAGSLDDNPVLNYHGNVGSYIDGTILSYAGEPQTTSIYGFHVNGTSWDATGCAVTYDGNPIQSDSVARILTSDTRIVIGPNAVTGLWYGNIGKYAYWPVRSDSELPRLTT